jgi:thiol:disulfide interchange protein DsbC
MGLLCFGGHAAAATAATTSAAQATTQLPKAPVSNAGAAANSTAAGNSAPASATPSGPVDAAPMSSPAAKTIKANIEARFPQTKVVDVQPSILPGLYEVVMEDEIVYTDATADHLLVGPLLDTQNHQNLTELHLNDRHRIDFNSLPFDKAIKIVKGNGSRKFAVFSDPDCPFCQQLEKTLLSVNDYTMYIFLFPIASLHPQAPSKAHAIWCAPNRVDAWNQWMQQKKLPPSKTCSGDPVDALQQLGDKLHVNSTPTMYMANGRRVAGAIPVADLEKALTAGSTNLASAAATPTAAK